MEPILLILIPLGLIMLINFLTAKEKIIEKTFWWDTWNGLQYSESTLYKLKLFPHYYIKHNIKYKNPQEHPDYKKFLKQVKQIKDTKNDTSKNKY